MPVEAKRAGHPRRSQTGLPIKQLIYVGHYPIYAYVEQEDYLRDKPSPHSLFYDDGVSRIYVATAITGPNNAELMPLIETLLSSTPPEILKRIVEIIPMPLPPTGAFRYYATPK